ncbi:WD domain containing protein [Pyrenophora tritici-repentis]|nr:WD domain containing protein [Pyrenophora tritici-repentis]
MAVEQQSATRPPALPTCILRGHASQIHCVQFVRQNSCLLTGDADGYVVYWDLSTSRALEAWKAHDGPILGVAQWGHGRMITHGRDNTLRIWQLHPGPSGLTERVPLPSDLQHQDGRTKPWLLHAFPVNTLNFCAFSVCYQHPSAHLAARDDGILVAVPGRDDTTIEVYQFPDERLKILIPRVQVTATGMAMAVKLVRHSHSRDILLLAGYEGGVTAVFRLPGNCTGPGIESAELVYLSQPHSQPILSLDASSDGSSYFTSSADAVIAKHLVPMLPKISKGQDSLDSRQNTGSDPPLIPQALPSFLSEQDAVNSSLSTASQDTGMQYETHEEDLSAHFAKHSINKARKEDSKPSGLSSMLSSDQQSRAKSTMPCQPITVQAPYKIVNTKHAGQQSLRVRSDGRLIVTGGWDARIRIYSSKTLKEVAVLKWHKQGVYAVAFSQILTEEDFRKQDYVRVFGGQAEPRETQVKLKHWVAAGAKDGKISLWEMY